MATSFTAALGRWLARTLHGRLYGFSAPSEQHLQNFCNLGYAASCSQLPYDRSADAVRFSIRA